MVCHVCGGSKLHARFSIPLSDGPYRDDQNAKPRTIYRCDSCGHLSADFGDADKLAKYYASLPEGYHCDHDRDLSRYEKIIGLLGKQSVRRVLDIGCGAGTFLAMLPLEVERFGIEPSKAAADLARAKGIRIVQYDELATTELRNTFDFVTAIDVAEHALNLQQLRNYLVVALRPGGTAIILTGDAESKSAKFTGQYWYYLNFAEHVTVFCPRSMRTWLQPDFSEIELTKAEHHRLNTAESVLLVRAWLLFPVKWLLRRIWHTRYSVSLYLPGGHMLVRATRK